jgi:hypothetical protein
MTEKLLQKITKNATYVPNYMFHELPVILSSYAIYCYVNCTMTELQHGFKPFYDSRK